MHVDWQLVLVHVDVVYCWALWFLPSCSCEAPVIPLCWRAVEPPCSAHGAPSPFLCLQEHSLLSLCACWRNMVALWGSHVGKEVQNDGDLVLEWEKVGCNNFKRIGEGLLASLWARLYYELKPWEQVLLGRVHQLTLWKGEKDIFKDQYMQ